MSNRRREQAPESRTHHQPTVPVQLRPTALTVETAAEAFGPLTHGCRVLVLSKGRVSFGAGLRHMLEATGPADVLVATWAIGSREIHELRQTVDDGRVRSLRLVIDPSFVRRHPAYTALLRARFGPDVIRLAANHTKLATVINDRWALTMRSSANLNENARTEFFEVEDARPLAEFINRTFSDWFTAPAGDQWDVPPSEHRRRFAAWRADEVLQVKNQPARDTGRDITTTTRSGLAPATAEDAKFFGNGWADTDLRRVGLTYER